MLQISHYDILYAVLVIIQQYDGVRIMKIKKCSKSII